MSRLAPHKWRHKLAQDKLAQRKQNRRDLVERVEVLEADVAELRRHSLRLAELTDVVQELLVPLASRDQDRIDNAIEKFQRSL